MPFKQAPFNTTKQLSGGSRLTGSDKAIYNRNKYQTELQNAHASFINMVHHIEDETRAKTNYYYNIARGLLADTQSHLRERASLYDNLEQQLKKETDFLPNMWTTHQVGVKTDKITTNMKFRDSDDNEVRFGNIREYVKQYPTIESFAKLQEAIKLKETQIRHKEEEYHRSITDHRNYLHVFDSDMQKATDKLITYNTILSEWQEVIKTCSYYNSVWFRQLPENKKQELLPDTITHRISQFTNTLNLMKLELEKYKSELNITDNKYPQVVNTEVNR